MIKYSVSVIVPVYGVEKYIDKCLKSLVSQTLKDIEIIVVNDGSKDNSQKIIDDYAKKYKNIKSYITEIMDYQKLMESILVMLIQMILLNLKCLKNYIKKL